MKIITWNCSGAFRKKIGKIKELNPDIMVIQECENPEKYMDKIDKENKFNFYWTGNNQHRGLGVFYTSDQKVEKLEWNDQWRNRNLKWFLPVSINEKIILLAVWAHKAEAKAFAYIGQFWLYMKNNKDKLKQTDIICGDLNSNAIWDSWDRWWNHTDCVGELSQANLFSVYHTLNDLVQGKEQEFTLFHRKNQETVYHIDYIFTDMDRIKRTKQFQVGDFTDWKDYSDHVPLIWEYEEA